MDKLIYLVPVMGVIGLLYTFIKFAWVAKQDAGNERMQEISRYIAEGAMAFLKAEWKILSYFVVLAAILLAFMGYSNPDSHWSIAIAFILGAILSATAGYIGMRSATKANVRTAQAAVAAANANIRQAELNLEYCSVTSPISGIAGTRLVAPGNLVGQGEATLLTTVSNVNPMRVYVSISEREYLQFVGGLTGSAEARPFPNGDAPLDLLLDNGTVYPHPGTSVLADRQVGPATGTIRIAAAFPSPGNILRPGQFGRVRATIAVKQGALVVPQRAVTELQGSYQIAVVNKDDKVEIRPVKVGARVGMMWVIEGGVVAGEKVVAEGLQKVRDGVAVKPVPFQPPAKG